MQTAGTTEQRTILVIGLRDGIAYTVIHELTHQAAHSRI